MKKTQLFSDLQERYSLDTLTLEELIAFSLKISREKLFLCTQIEDSTTGEIYNLVEKVALGYPAAYVLQKKNFFGLDFFVDDHVLIPRDDTELLVQKAIDHIHTLSGDIYYFDIGTGSGCIPISIVSEIGDKIQHSYLFDISSQALEVAKKNSKNLLNTKKFSFFCEDFHLFGGRFPFLDISKDAQIVITANLPYIKVHDIYLDKKVLDYEPTLALFGGAGTGFELYDDFFTLLLVLKEQGFLSHCTLFVEIGFDQSQIARTFLEKKGLKFEFFRDTGYHDRVIRISL